MRGVPPIQSPAFAFRVSLNLLHSARPVEVQVRIEMTLVVLFDCLGLRRRNMSVAHMLADHSSVLGFYQSVVIRMPRP